MENHKNMDDLGVPLFQETSVWFGNNLVIMDKVPQMVCKQYLSRLDYRSLLHMFPSAEEMQGCQMVEYLDRFGDSYRHDVRVWHLIFHEDGYRISDIARQILAKRI